MTARHKVGTIAGTMAVTLALLQGTALGHPESFNQKAASYADMYIGRVAYTYGGTSPRTGFDCSGMSQYIYHKLGKYIPRTAEAQFYRFHRERKSAAWGGDLVFFHVDSNPDSYVYHVAIYEGHNHIVSATTPSQGVLYQSIWTSDVTFGTITH